MCVYVFYACAGECVFACVFVGTFPSFAGLMMSVLAHEVAALKCIRKIHSLHSILSISQTTIVVFKINSSYIFQDYYLTILKLL